TPSLHDALPIYFLRRNGHHPEAMRLLAQVADRLQVSADAELLLESCVELSPGFDRGLYDYVNFLLKMQKFEKAHRQARVLLARDPENLEYQSMLASATAGIGEHERAIEMFDRVLAKTRHQNTLYVMRGHAQKTIGAFDAAVRSYQAAYEIQPDYGDAFWSLANTKTYRFTDHEIAHMQRYERLPSTGTDDRIHF